MAEFIDWKYALDNWERLSDELRSRIKEAFEALTPELLEDLFKRQPDAKKLHERVVGAPPPALAPKRTRDETLDVLRKLISKSTEGIPQLEMRGLETVSPLTLKAWLLERPDLYTKFLETSRINLIFYLVWYDIIPPEGAEHITGLRRLDELADELLEKAKRDISVINTVKNWRLLRKEAPEVEVVPEIKAPPTPTAPGIPKPAVWTSSLERRIRDRFKATFTRAGVSPTRFMAEYREELPVVKTLETAEEMLVAVEELANEIIRREKARKVKPPRIRPPVEAPPTRVPRWREEEIEPMPFIEAPAYPLRSLSEMRFPRLPAGIELDQIRPRFIQDLLNCGIYNPQAYLPQFKKKFAEVLFKSWDAMYRGYQLLVEQICKGLEVRYPVELRALPYESIEDAVYWLTSQKRFESAEEIAAELHELGTPTTAEEVRIFIRKGYEDNVPNFVIVTKEYLERLLGEPLD